MLAYATSFFSRSNSAVVVPTTVNENKAEKNPEAMAILDLLIGTEPDDPEEKARYIKYSANIYEVLSVCNLECPKIPVYLDGIDWPLNLTYADGSTTLELDGETVTLMGTTFEQLLQSFKPTVENTAKYDEILELFKPTANNTVNFDHRDVMGHFGGELEARFEEPVDNNFEFDGFPDVELYESLPIENSKADEIDTDFATLSNEQLDAKIYSYLSNAIPFTCKPHQVEQNKFYELTYWYGSTKKILVSTLIQGAEINEFIANNIGNDIPVFAPYEEKRWYKGFEQPSHTVLLAIVNHQVYIIDSKAGLSTYCDLEDSAKEEATILALKQQEWDDPYTTHYVFENLNQVLQSYGMHGGFEKVNPFGFLNELPKENYVPYAVNHKLKQLPELSLPFLNVRNQLSDKVPNNGFDSLL